MLPEQEQFFNQLYQDNFWNLNRYANIHLGPSQAEEIVQDTFCQAVVKIDDLTHHENPAGWLMQSLIYRIKNLQRKNLKETLWLVSLESESVEELATPERFEDAVEEEESLQAISKTLKETLSEDERYILRRFVLEKASHKEISEELGISIGASQKRLERLKNKLSRQFSDHEEK